MNIVLKKNMIWLGVILSLMLIGNHFRNELIEENIDQYCARKLTVFRSSPEIGYEVVHYAQYCDKAGPTYEEVRLKSKAPPYKQKSVFRYQYQSSAEGLPNVRWLGVRDVEVSLPHVTDIEYRYSKIRDLTVHYKLQGHEALVYPEKDIWAWMGFDFGWQEIKYEPNVSYVDSD